KNRMKRIFVGLGSNLNNPIQQVQSALCELTQLPNTRWIQASSLYRTAPMGVTTQPDFINAVAELYCALNPFDLLAELLALEQQHDRIRKQHWGERTLDLDLLLYGDEIITCEQLMVPHPGLKQRDFVLVPLAEIAPDLTLPDGEFISVALAHCPSSPYLELLR
ncbi:MAG: 2-amino-4-hydroxy-6-hydroxymethyldihydropteridine diphosphokinase, partial [Gammaproteobacteria bacterium]